MLHLPNGNIAGRYGTGRKCRAGLRSPLEKGRERKEVCTHIFGLVSLTARRQPLRRKGRQIKKALLYRLPGKWGNGFIELDYRDEKRKSGSTCGLY